MYALIGAGVNPDTSSTPFSWTGIGTSIFSTSGNSVISNGVIFVAVGEGTNTIAYATNVTTWTGLGTTVFSQSGDGITWTGTKFVAVGNGITTIAYSSDGITWTSLGNSIFYNGNKITVNNSGTLVASGDSILIYATVGQGGNTIPNKV